MIDWLHRPERGGFKLLRLVATGLSTAGLMCLISVVLLLLAFLFTGGGPFVSSTRLGLATVCIVIICLLLIAVGQSLHLAIGIWRALMERASRGG